MAIKYNLDRAVAWFGFHHAWYFWNYIKPHGFAGIDAVPPNDQAFYVVLLLTSLPFLILGIVLTLRRLRSAGLPMELCLLFFVPVINLVFFVVLCLLPAKQVASPQPGEIGLDVVAPDQRRRKCSRQHDHCGPGWYGTRLLSTEALRNYGWGLFVALPFSMGLVSVLIYAGSREAEFSEVAYWSPFLPILFVWLCLFVVAAEGAICLIMAAPIGLVLSLFGGIVGYIIVGNRTAPISPAAMMLVCLFPCPSPWAWKRGLMKLRHCFPSQVRL